MNGGMNRDIGGGMTGAETKTLAALAPLHAWWQGLAMRERLGVALGGSVLVLYAVWALAVQPAWRTLNTAPVEIDALDAQLQTMQGLAGEAGVLRAAPPVNLEQAGAALKAATERLGDKGRLSLQGERAVLTFNAIGTQALSGWLAEARSGARARPIEATLTRAAQGYNGTLVLTIGGSL